MRVWAVALAVSLTVLTGPLLAHHSSSAEFDPNAKPVTVTGVITRIELRNPHSNFYLDVKDPQTGQVNSWRVEYGGSWMFGVGKSAAAIAGMAGIHVPGPVTSNGAAIPIPHGVVTTGGNGMVRTDEKAMFGALKPGAVVSANGLRANDGSHRLSFTTLLDDQGKSIIG